MLFPTISFAIFFLIVYFSHRTLVSRPGLWKAFMLAASYFFYGWWDWRFVGLLAISSVVNQCCALCIHNRDNERARRAWLILALCFNLGTLGFFKYYGFFTLQMYALLGRLGLSIPLPLLDIILPVGISFFTFQAMSYVVDIYRRELEPTQNILDFAVYLAFFPQLVAGPIVRAKVFLPQLSALSPQTSVDAGRAVMLIMAGLFKKIVIANYLAQHIVDPVFAHPAAYGAADNILAVYGYAIQIYCDFSAYSDIAIGVALLLGFKFPINFNAPYFATSIQDFWRRWHISLSTWLRDYLFIPMGGSRVSTPRIYRNLFIVFLLGGLWHGAAWTFIVWGLLHGAYLMTGRMVSVIRNKHKAVIENAGISPVWHILKMIWVFHLVCFTWVFFRAETFADAWEMLKQFTAWNVSSTMINGTLLLFMLIGFMTQFMDGDRMMRLWNRLNQTHPVWQGAVAAIVLVLILSLGPKGVSPFIYFQF